MEQMPKKHSNSSKAGLFLLLLFAAIAAVSGWKLFSILRQTGREERNFESMAVLVEQYQQNQGGGQGEGDGEDLADSGEAEESPEEAARRSRLQAQEAYAALQKQIPDFYGWVSIPETRINYPVMRTPEDAEYYIHRDFHGEYSYSGVPFFSEGCFPGCGNDLIYGHNMKNGTMFADLLSYEKEEYWKEHPVIYFDTPETLGEYQVFAAFYSEAYPQDAEGVFRFYQYTDLTAPERFVEYISQCRKSSLYDTGVSAEFGDEILTLVTCSYHTEEGRFVVAAVKKQDLQD